MAQVLLLDAEPAGAVALRVDVNHEHFLLLQAQGRSKIDGCSRFAYAALLVDDRDGFSHLITLYIEKMTLV